MNDVGRKGEERVLQWLELQGYTIIARNWRMPTGEIDIIMLKAGVLVFVEVKTMLSQAFSELDVIVGKKKQQRICKTAKHFLAMNRKYSDMIIRFDVVVLQKNPFLNIALEPVHLIEAFGDYDESN